MTNKYSIPVELKTIVTIEVEANTESEAVSAVTNTIKHNSKVSNMYDQYKILCDQIECDNDDKMLDKLSEDLGRPCESYDSNRETFVVHCKKR